MRRLREVLALSLICGTAGSALAGEVDVARAARTDGPVYFIGELLPVYAKAEASYPELEELEDRAFTIGRTVDGYVAPRQDVRTVEFRLFHLAAAPTQRFYASGLRHVNEQIVTWLNQRGLRGVRVSPHPEDIEPGTNRDLRPRDEGRLRLLITVGEARLEPEGAEGGEEEFKIRALESDGPAYPLDALLPLYAEDHPDHPPLHRLNRAVFVLGRTADGYVGPRPGVKPVRFKLGQLTAAPEQQIYASGLRALNEQIVVWLNDQGLTGVLVRPHEEDIDPDSGLDLRNEGEADLRLLVWTGRVKELRTFASGDRVEPAERVDNALHAVVKDRSPVKPGAVRGQDLVRKDDLEAFAARLNRHPGRRVDMALSPGREPGSVYLDYLIAENKPWTVYAQWSNTGTDETAESRQRFGYTHTQLSGRDDILRVDYLTGDFDEVHALSTSYDAPFFGSDRVRWRFDGSGSTYESDMIDFPGTIDGDQWRVGGELIANVYQRKEFFLDLLAGVRWQEIRIDSDLALEKADDRFLLPRVGSQIERKTQTSNLFARLIVEVNNAELSGNDADDLSDAGGLGRVDPDEDWILLRWDSTFSTYLEPLFNRAAWDDPSTPATSTLAHELALLFRGQHAFGNRLIAQEQMVAGGVYTVRGYPEAATELPTASGAGDTVFIGSLEYRFHVPRIFGLQRETANLPILGDFRVAPQRVYGMPDWDLILRAFIDAARIQRHDRSAFEKNETLLSTGFGAEIQLWQNIIGRADLGIVLDESSFLGVDRGDTEAHFSITTLY
jgi:hemolysin activation/secretion protein